eukprot:gnl/TRDRNA2_/TRDRNA2_175385_c0_seq1.p1 gnl/TRDRNA2_/TRDRNA2_175385_c0~~gnl/TRDRNA2_/TRDRNA2_175385_c0_seq1.p1  ORF type:complete len:120 (+),score=6.30 gnl/TRDRNA2_/TRDRNA2_175385_c0_seq1:57-362(+)
MLSPAKSWQVKVLFFSKADAILLRILLPDRLMAQIEVEIGRIAILLQSHEGMDDVHIMHFNAFPLVACFECTKTRNSWMHKLTMWDVRPKPLQHAPSGTSD